MVHRETTPSVRFRAEVRGVPAETYSVYGSPGDARIRRNVAVRTCANATIVRYTHNPFVKAEGCMLSRGCVLYGG
jgi:hypothetical protein